MKIVLYGLIVLVGVFGYPENPERLTRNLFETEDDEWSYVPQVDGTFRLTNHKQAKLEYQQYPQPRSDFVVIFQLFTRLNPDEPQIVRENNTSTLLESNFNPKHPTRLIVHGWMGHANATINNLIRPAFLKRGDYNVFVVDWSSAARTINYISARYSVEDAATQIADFIDFLHLFGGMKFEDLTVIGHSLGAHASGIAGKKVKRGRIQTIIGLDPALPLFSYKIPEERLSPDDAIYVQTIQTNGGYLGFHQPIGQASIYPNWGTSQPGCGFDTTGACAHRRSYIYFAESLHQNNSFIPFDCIEYQHVLNKRYFSVDKSIRMGGEPSEYGYFKGAYYVPTNTESPFGLGDVKP